jgi:hypothetical protein
VQRARKFRDYVGRGQQQQQQQRWPFNESVQNVQRQRAQAPCAIYEPLATQLHVQHRYSSNGAEVKLFDVHEHYDNSPESSIPVNRSTQAVNVTKQPNAGNQTKTFPKLTNEEESDTEEEEEDYITCCDFSNSRQPLCNEGTKNICTLTIWAVIIFAICNRFLMHMSLFLHRRDGVGKGINNNNFEYAPVGLSKDVTGVMEQNAASSASEVAGQLGQGLQ